MVEEGKGPHPGVGVVLAGGDALEDLNEGGVVGCHNFKPASRCERTCCCDHLGGITNIKLLTQIETANLDLMLESRSLLLRSKVAPWQWWWWSSLGIVEA